MHGFGMNQSTRNKEGREILFLREIENAVWITFVKLKMHNRKNFVKLKTHNYL